MLIGLTGGIGCGKSSALAFCREEGWKVFDSDAYCAELYASPSGEVAKKIRSRWGGEFIGGDGLPDKRKIADLVFRSEEERKWLGDLIHPVVLRKMRATASGGEDMVCDVPLLFEAGWRGEFEHVACVWAPESLRLKRLAARGMDGSSARKRFAAQMPADMKLEMADFGLINAGSMQNLRRQCVELLKQLARQER